MPADLVCGRLCPHCSLPFVPGQHPPPPGALREARRKGHKPRHFLFGRQDRTHTLEDLKPEELTEMPLPHSDQWRTVPAQELTTVARVLVCTRPGLIRQLLTQPGPRPGGLGPQQTPQRSRGRPSPIRMPPARNFPSRPNLTVRGRPLHTQRGIHGATQHLLAQGPEMDNELFLSDTNRDPRRGILPSVRW